MKYYIGPRNAWDTVPTGPFDTFDAAYRETPGHYTEEQRRNMIGTYDPETETVNAYGRFRKQLGAFRLNGEEETEA